jgi:malate dehydrogenase (oxaloacetate-decarboxylating)(NADP+)
VVHSKRRDLAGHIRECALVTSRRTFGGALRGADVFIGASRPRALTASTLRNMNVRPLMILLLAAAESDLRPDAVSAVRRDAVVATGSADFPNQISGAMAFPALFRGALDVQAPYINDAMQLAAATAVADLARKQMCWRGEGPVRGFGPKYIVPHRSDARLLATVASAVAGAAIHNRAAAPPREGFDKARYARALTDRMFGNHLAASHAA